MPPCWTIVVARKGEAKASRLRAWLDEHKPAQVGDNELAQLATWLAPVSERYLRQILRSSGVALDPLIEGVVQADFEELERTLRALEAVYQSDDRDRSRRARAAVLKAKEHARFALRRLSADPARSAEKQEVLLWLQTWLENPTLFSAWVQIRRSRMPLFEA